MTDSATATSLEALFREHGRGLLLFARGLVSERELAEDAVQQAFVNLVRKGLGEVENLRAYLYGAVRHAAFNLARGEQRREQTWQEACRRGAWRVLTESSEDPETLAVLNAAIAELPEYERQVVLMKVWGGLTFDEIGAAMETPLATASSRYRAALARLRGRLLARGWS